MRVASGLAVHCFPSADEEFRAATQDLIAEGAERGRPTDELVREVQARLRERYPRAVVRPKDLAAELGDPIVQTIYAFRDGRAA